MPEANDGPLREYTRRAAKANGAVVVKFLHVRNQGCSYCSSRFLASIKQERSDLCSLSPQFDLKLRTQDL